MRGLSSRRVGLIGVFAALHVTLYSMPLGWRSWAICLEPIEGIILGPWVGFSAALVGSTVARILIPREIELWMFGVIAEPMGVLGSGLLARRCWKPVIAISTIMLTAYFSHPLGRELPLWTILDILFALALTYPTAKITGSLSGGNIRRLTLSVVLVSFVGTTIDALTRVFLLIPAGLYAFLGWPSDVVYATFVSGAIASYMEDLLVVIVSSLVSTPLIVALRRIPDLNIESKGAS
jgi:hypothetical protein